MIDEGFIKNGKRVLVVYIMEPKAVYDHLKPLVYYINPENEEMRIAYLTMLFDRDITDGPPVGIFENGKHVLVSYIVVPKVELALADSLELDVLAAYIMKPKEGLIKNGRHELVAYIMKPKQFLVSF